MHYRALIPTTNPEVTMRLFVLFLFIPLCIPDVSAQHLSSAEHPLQGAWKLIFQRSVFETQIDTTLKRGERFPGGDQIKILTSTHFAFGRQSEDGENVSAGGGRYRVEGDTYIEMIEYHTTGALVGQEIPFSWEIKDGLWYHQGDFSNFRLEEVWTKIE